MDRSTIVRTGIAGAVAGIGLSVGGVAMANADTGDSSTTGTTTTQQQPGPRDGGQLAATLAKQLGLSESKVKTALDAVRDAQKPTKPADGTRPTPPTDAQRAAHQAAFVKALAAKLDVSEAKVKAALAAAQTESRATERSSLKTKLDAAVKAGTLTEADEASVLKAFDAKVIGGLGGPGGPGGHGGGPGGPAA
jgi:hypothetical protein